MYELTSLEFNDVGAEWTEMLIVQSCVFLIEECVSEKAGALVWSLPGRTTFSTAAPSDRAETVPPN